MEDLPCLQLEKFIIEKTTFTKTMVDKFNLEFLQVRSIQLSFYLHPLKGKNTVIKITGFLTGFLNILVKDNLVTWNLIEVIVQ